MKKVSLFLTAILLTSAAILVFGQNRPVLSDSLVRKNIGCDGPKREETSNGVQVRLEICGSDRDGYDIDAANPDTGKKFDCRYSFTLTGTKKDGDGSVEVSREKTVTVSSTAKGWFNAYGEAGIKDGKNFRISSFSVSCSE